MNKSAIFHLSKTNYSYSIGNNNINVRIRLGKDDFDKVNIIFGDKYKWHMHDKKEMINILSDFTYDYYESNLEVDTKRVAYFFELIKNNKIYYFTELGFHENKDFLDDLHLCFFQYPFINGIDIHSKPSWVENAIFYQIFPDRFYNGDITNEPVSVEPWGSKPNNDNFMGGDIEGIRSKIPYFKELAINVIYLTPIFKSNSNHKYDIIDYYEIDEIFGTKDEFKRLVKELHSNNIKIVLDAVFNHSGIDFFAFKDLCEKGEKSKYKDWFHVKKLPIDIEGILSKFKTTKDWQNWYLNKNNEDIRSYEMFAFYPYMPKLNTENQELSNYLIDVAKYWIEEYEIDGWRLDVANEIDHNFWRKFRNEIKKINPEVVIIGEIWHNPEAWLRGDQFDSTMNYPLMNVIKRYFATELDTKEEFIYKINELLMRNTDQVNSMMLNLLDSHDMKRFYTICKNHKSNFLLSYLFLFTSIGIPMIYYGDEIGMGGGDDPDCRKCMEWDESKWDMKIYNMIKKMVRMRTKYESLKYGSFRWLNIHDRLLSFIRETKNEKILIIINNGNNKVTFDKPKDINLLEDILNEKVLKSDKIEVNASSFVVIKIL